MSKNPEGTKSGEHTVDIENMTKGQFIEYIDNVVDSIDSYDAGEIFSVANLNPALNDNDICGAIIDYLGSMEAESGAYFEADKAEIKKLVEIYRKENKQQ